MLQNQWLFDSYLQLFNEVRTTYQELRITYVDSTGKLRVRRGQKAIHLLAQTTTIRVNGKDAAYNKLMLLNIDYSFIIMNMISNKFTNWLLMNKMSLYYTMYMSADFDSLVQKLIKEMGDVAEKDGLVKSILLLKSQIEEMNKVIPKQI